ncbi:MAG: hypothetical protein EOO11_19410 [Chitinophagaceae bacterium]|nr:MAG: hypothetical protein EOO11_19410 [Chitinophagaceae bacterium]
MANRIWIDPEEPGSYGLGSGDAPATRVRYNAATGALRLQAPGTQRLFFLEGNAPPFHKITLHNEYGLRIGTCSFDDSQHRSGTLRLDEEKFRFILGPDGLLLQPKSGPGWLVEAGALLPPLPAFLTAVLFACCWDALQPAHRSLRPA